MVKMGRAQQQKRREPQQQKQWDRMTPTLIMREPGDKRPMMRKMTRRTTMDDKDNYHKSVTGTDMEMANNTT